MLLQGSAAALWGTASCSPQRGLEAMGKLSPGGTWEEQLLAYERHLLQASYVGMLKTGNCRWL